MSGQQPWHAPDGPRHPGSDDRLGEPGRKPENKSRPDAVREWISTTAGVISSIVALVGLLAGGAAVSVKIFTQPPKPSPSITPTPNPTFSNSPSPPPVNLQSALLSSGTLGSPAYVGSKGTDLSQIGEICGGPVHGANSTAYETIQDYQNGTVLTEALVTWHFATDAGQAITIDRQAVDQSGSCSVTSSGVTAVYSGDDAGSPPLSCVSPGHYFATQVKVSSSSSTFPDNGFAVVAQCGTITIYVQVYNDQPGTITQQVADGYLSSAISKFDSATS
jgi:hypothetical protein